MCQQNIVDVISVSNSKQCMQRLDSFIDAKIETKLDTWLAAFEQRLSVKFDALHMAIAGIHQKTSGMQKDIDAIRKQD